MERKVLFSGRMTEWNILDLIDYIWAILLIYFCKVLIFFFILEVLVMFLIVWFYNSIVLNFSVRKWSHIYHKQIYVSFSSKKH